MPSLKVLDLILKLMKCRPVTADVEPDGDSGRLLTPAGRDMPSTRCLRESKTLE